jgi:hypothetical protein
MASLTLRDTALSDAWSREAYRVRALAAHIGHPLDEEELLLLDLRDLHAMRARLERAGLRRGRHRVSFRWLFRAALRSTGSA